MLRVGNVVLVAACCAAGVIGQTIGSKITISGTGSKGDPAVAYSGQSRHFVAVWSQRVNNRMQVRARRIASNGSVVGSEIVVASSNSYDNHRPTVAYVRKSNRFVICWYRRPAGGGRAIIYGRTMAPHTGSMSGTKLLANAATDSLSPVLGGDRTLVDNKAILVWQRAGVGILAARLNVPAFGVPSIVSSVYSVSGASDARHPSISRCGGDKRRYVVAFVRRAFALRGDEVYARAVGADAAPDGTAVTVSSATGADVFPSVDGDGTRFFVAWQGAQGTSKVSTNVYGRALSHDGARVKLESSKISIATSTLDEREPCVAFMAKKFFVGYSAEYSSNHPYKHDLYFKFYCLDKSALCGSGKVRGPNVRDGYGAVVARYAGGSATADDGLLVFASSSASRWTNASMIGQRVESMGSGGKMVSLGGNCGKSGSAYPASAFAIGNKDFGIGLQGASASAKVALLNISPVQPIPICGSCRITVPTVLLPVPIVAGKAMQQLPVPCDPKLMNVSMIFQYYVLGSGSTPCAGLGGLSFSNRLQGTVGF